MRMWEITIEKMSVEKKEMRTRSISWTKTWRTPNRVKMKLNGVPAPQGTTVYTSGLQPACAHILKHHMKYSLLLPLNTGVISVEGKSLLPGSLLPSKLIQRQVNGTTGYGWEHRWRLMLASVAGGWAEFCWTQWRIKATSVDRHTARSEAGIRRRGRVVIGADLSV